uniref:histidine kinase n=1 Tax=Chromera velia CCMP2878 TaxID=1169474 RepID=A0A0G4FBN4_9ALVE|eukprot:Cvel_16182.t1-p1 / transcript=Cvel_16182.t1 / gene=Cvel_16182 / organism=Chromera_velia_CCMP2878 / gene_product=Ethylene receptor, putative / transcript_product=Ethylene receptor, putative / location=Cvel_scaffold1234:35731-38986(+) / protein_length=817 / sequence_SO=supercontig / SO=protein_coding / is_pseudo=false
MTRTEALRRQLERIKWPFLCYAGPPALFFVVLLTFLGVFSGIGIVTSGLTGVALFTFPLVSLQFGRSMDIVAALMLSLAGLNGNFTMTRLPPDTPPEEVQFHHVASFIFAAACGNLLQYRTSVFCAYNANLFTGWVLMRFYTLENASVDFHMKTTFSFVVLVGLLCVMLRYLSQGAFLAGVELERLRQHTEQREGQVEHEKDQKHSFLAYIMHEVRNPLSAACLLMCEQEMLIAEMKQVTAKMKDKKKKHPEDQGEFAEIEPLLESLNTLAKTVQSQIDQMGSICNDVLHLEKLASGRFEYNVGVGSLASFFSHAAKEAETVLKQKDVTLTTEIAIDPQLLSKKKSPSTWADFPRLRQVISNFMSNARKFTPKGGEVTFRMEVSALSICPTHHAPGNCAHSSQLPDSAFSFNPMNPEENPQWIHIRFSVRDSGVGIAPEDLPKLFKPYGQIRAGEQQQGGGTGLGLCICRVFVEAHSGGNTGVLSKGAGEGSEFFFEFDSPLASVPEKEADEERGSANTPGREERVVLCKEMLSSSGRGMKGQPRRLSTFTAGTDPANLTPSSSPPLSAYRRGCPSKRLPRDRFHTVLLTESPPSIAASASSQQSRWSAAPDKETVRQRKKASQTDERQLPSESLSAPQIKRASLSGYEGEALRDYEQILFERVKAQDWFKKGKQHIADILVVDDNAVCQMAVTLALRRMGFSVESSGDGLAALSRFKQGERYRLVLIDRNMPKMEGPQAVREILSHLQSLSPPPPSPVFVGLTGQTERCNDFEEEGAVRTVLKPITAKNLEAVFEELDFVPRGSPSDRKAISRGHE